MFITIATMTLATAGLVTATQFPAVQNAQIEVRTVTTVAEDVRRYGAGAEPVWLGWSVPMVRGERNVCSAWSSQSQSVRGTYLEGWVGRGDTPPPFVAAPGPVALEAGTRLVVLLRVVDGQVERIRMVADDCPVDAGSLRFVRLDGVTADASVRFLEAFIPSGPVDAANRRNTTSSALSAIALHQGTQADAVLERLARTAPESDTGRQAASWMARARGRRGFDELAGMIDAAATSQARGVLVGALAQSPLPDTYDALLRLAAHTDERVRVEAVRAISASPDARAKRYLEDVLRR